MDLAAVAPLVLAAGVELAVDRAVRECMADAARSTSSAITSRPTPSIRDGVQVKYLSTTALLSPTASKICAPR